MAKKKSRKNKKKKRIRLHRSFILPFFITLTAAVAAGVLALAAHQWIMEPVKTQKTDAIVPRESRPQERIEREDESALKGPESEGEETEKPSKYQEQLADAAYMEENNIACLCGRRPV